MEKTQICDAQNQFIGILFTAIEGVVFSGYVNDLSSRQ